MPKSNDTAHSSHNTYVDLFEYSIPGNIFAITNDVNIRKQVDQSLYRLGSLVNNEYRNAKGGAKREQLNSKTRVYHLFEGMIMSVKEMKMEYEMVKDELELWKANCQNIQERMEQLYVDMKEALKEKDEKISELQEANKDLQDYIRRLEKPDHLVNKGKDFSEAKNKSRTIKTFMLRAKTALWFADSFGFDIHSITLKEQKTGKHLSAEAETLTGTGDTAGFDGLPENEKKSGTSSVLAR